MNSSTFRRLAADHAALRCNELPPNWLFPSSDADSVPDDLTQLVALLTGPQGTPYSNGLWKVFLKIPDDYPKSPPKAFFRTKIWHPNVEENSGSVCVDTLKKDWEIKLTLRDVLITISCLLIQPNPDSALNATAGHLLQEDYESFARQARLMTSIHASIPSELREACALARRRGEGPETALLEYVFERPSARGKAINPSSVVMKRPSESTRSRQSSTIKQKMALGTDDEATEEDEISASKENDPALSPIPVLPPSPKRPSLSKRPLSDLLCSVAPAEEEVSCLSQSEKNVADNVTIDTNKDALQAGPELAGKTSLLNLKNKNSHDINVDSRAVSAPEPTEAENGRSVKRICSDEAKENAQVEMRHENQRVQEAKPIVSSSMARNCKVSSTRMASAPGALGGGKVGKPRVGLRRL